MPQSQDTKLGVKSYIKFNELCKFHVSYTHTHTHTNTHIYMPLFPNYIFFLIIFLNDKMRLIFHYSQNTSIYTSIETCILQYDTPNFNYSLFDQRMSTTNAFLNIWRYLKDPSFICLLSKLSKRKCKTKTKQFYFNIHILKYII